MLIGVAIYFIIHALPITRETEDEVYFVVSHLIQPCLIFFMLFLSFLKVEPHTLKPHRWHAMLLFVQGTMMVLCALAAIIPGLNLSTRLLIEGAMLCFICPTATASAVIVQKLDGSLSGIVTYIILCNILVTLLAPPLLTFVEPELYAHSHLSTVNVMCMIMGKVFPLLLCPLFVAFVVRHYSPKLMQRLLSIPDMAFYLWLIALALAITVTARTIADSHVSLLLLAGFALVTILCCVFQFVMGRHIGKRFGLKEKDGLTAGQAFGQKNTVFVIWLGLMFLNPITSVVGGFYSVWHNVINSWQLYRKGVE